MHGSGAGRTRPAPRITGAAAMSRPQEVPENPAANLAEHREQIGPGSLVMVYRDPDKCMQPVGPAQVAVVFRGEGFADYCGRQALDVAVRFLLTGEVRRRVVSEPLAEYWDRVRRLDAEARECSR